MNSYIMDKAFVNGQWVKSLGGKEFKVCNPANGEVIGAVPYMDGEDANLAIQAAEKAFTSWSRSIAKDRAKILRKLYELIIKNKEELARLITLENGKVISEARAEIEYAASFVEWFSEEAKRIYGQVVPSVKAGQRFFCLKQPVGVVGAITPWNFPLAMITRKLAPALAAGCTIIIKPSEETPYSALALAKLCEEAGVPTGVINIIFGDAPSIGEAITSSPTIKLLTFTGSTSVGKMLMAKAAGTVKKVALELGGNAPFIVFEDANLELAVKGLITSKLRSGGQSCICTNRVYVQESVMKDFSSLLISEFQKIKVGHGLDETNNLGPMINKKAVEKIASLLADAQAHGSAVLYATDISAPELKQGCFTAPTVINNTENGLPIESTEIFGPVASLFTFKDEEEVIKRANNTNYGLASYLYTSDKNRIWRVAEALEYGMVGINDVAISTEMTSFGGIKESGLGREGGHHGIDEYLEDKFIAIS